MPLTYRGSPLTGADDALATTMTHTTLGDRWVYDACHDPVYVATLVTAVVTGGREADLFLAADDGRLVPEPMTTHVRGSRSPGRTVPALQPPQVTHDGTVTSVAAGVVIALQRVPLPVRAGAAATLTGTWPGQSTPLLLAEVELPG
ncbi:hypothetical protein GCM10027446_17970 [Angustibacter peucedani]